MSFRIIIPARIESSRLPGKVLMDIAGKPMLQHVYERASQTKAISVVIATDDEGIANTSKKIGAEVCMTSKKHLTGTDRLSEAATLLNYDPDDIIVNVQADEPMIPFEIIDQVAQNLATYDLAKVATLCQRFHDLEKLHNPNNVKVVFDAKGYALYFSRSVIPWLKSPEINTPEHVYYHHIGLYAYRVEFIQRYASLPPCPLEAMESLEQLRVLWNGEKIHVEVACKNPPQDVNTEADLQKVRNIIHGGMI